MLKEISNDIRAAFQSNQNAVVQLLLANLALFLVVGTSRVVSWAFKTPALDSIIFDYLSLSSNPLDLLFHIWTPLTYAFIHLDLSHFIFNMLGLYWFGQILQDFLGPKRIWQFYLAGALSGGLLFLIIFSLIGAQSIAPPTSHLLGASGAVYGIICGAAFLVPNYTMNLLFFGPVRLKYIAAATVLISFLQIPNGNPGGNIAHLGGALGGILYLKYLQGSLWKPKSMPKRPVLKGKVVKLDSPKSTFLSDQEELDRLLDKISEKGINSLSKEERNRLEYLSKPSNTNE
ncbi:MAG TPA: rhomboid family intramembrane serine protease [Catalimonadaceae bacterium]|jgi:membrane associated rhomboid family serine protease|nr:rhomboid family intramembrane serine protease [Catalimonadaceae bacterium]